MLDRNVDIRIMGVKCLRCGYFEDRGLRKDYVYNKKKKIIRTIECRFWCDFYKEYLKTLYEICTAFNEGII